MVRTAPRAGQDRAGVEFSQRGGDAREAFAIVIQLRLHALRRFLCLPGHGGCVHAVILDRSLRLSHRPRVISAVAQVRLCCHIGIANFAASRGSFKGVTSDKTNKGSSGAHPIEPLVLLAPLDGWAAPLAEVPDPVFADRMMGDGLAIDPTASLLCAPCDGEVMLLHAARHAITLRAANGAEILITPIVIANGDDFAIEWRLENKRVARGQELMRVRPLGKMSAAAAQG